MKYFSNKGSVLVITLTVMTILVLFTTISSGYVKTMLKQMKYKIKKSDLNYFAFSGFIRAFDNMQSNEGLSGNVLQQNNMLLDYSFEEEQGKLNINAVDLKSIKILINLIIQLGVEEETAKTISYSIIDWKDNDNKESDSKYSAEDNFYLGLKEPYKCKNYFFENIEELLFVRGMTKEIYMKLCPHISLYPQNGRLRLNLERADEIIVRSFALIESKNIPNIELSDVESLIQKMMEYREKDTSLEKIPFNIKEKTLLASLNKYNTKVNRFLRVNVSAVDKKTGIKTNIRALINRQNMSVLLWEMN